MNIIGFYLFSYFSITYRTVRKPAFGLQWIFNNNLLQTEREGRTGEYWPEVVAVRTEPSEVRTKTTEGQYSPVRLELARLVSGLLYGTRAMLVLNFPAFENKKKKLMTVSTETVCMAKFRPRKNQSERSDLPCCIIKLSIYLLSGFTTSHNFFMLLLTGCYFRGFVTLGNVQYNVACLKKDFGGKCSGYRPT